MPINAQVGSALISGASSLLGGLFGSNSQKNANRTNLQIAHLNNQWQERMQQNNFAFQREMNTYNSAKNQRKRLEEAGLNPYLMMNGGSAGTGQSSPVMPSVSQPNMQGYDWSPAMSAVGDSFQTLMSQQIQDKAVSAAANKDNEDAEGIRIDNLTRNTENLMRIQELIARTNNEELKTMYEGLQMNILQAQKSAIIDQPYLQNKQTEMQTSFTIAQTTYQQLQSMLSAKELETFDKRFLQELCVLASQANANNASAEAALANALEIQERTKGIKIDNYIKKNTIQHILNQTKWNSLQAKYGMLETKWKSKRAQRDYRYSSELEDGDSIFNMPVNDYMRKFFNTGKRVIGFPLHFGK